MAPEAVIITGASRGLGAATARIAARLGANVVLAARSIDQLEAEARQIQAAGGQALALRADVSREQDCRAVIQQAEERFGRIDALVNNGGTIEPIGPIAEADPQEWQRNWAVNVLGPVMLAQMALPLLRRDHGRIVNVSSGAALNVIGGWGAYSIAKAALTHLTRILASEEPDITVVAFRPGIVDTDMQALIREKGKNRMADSNYRWLFSQFERGELLPPETPGRALACLALYAPPEWSGELLTWDEQRLQQLVRAHPLPSDR